MNENASAPYRVAIVGASTLQGREIKTILSERSFPVRKMVLMDSDEDMGSLTDYEGEPSVSLAISEGNFEFLDLAFFAGDPSTTLRHAPLAQKASFVMVDLTGAFFRDGKVPLYLAGQTRSLRPFRGLVSSPHSAAISIGVIMKRLSVRHTIRRSSVSIFDPASERGKTGLDELQQQTLSIFSFQKGPQDIFQQQLAFNLLSQLGQGAGQSLIDAEEKIAFQLGALLGGRCPLPALSLIQAPIFHSHSFSVFIEFDRVVSIEQVERDLACKQLTVRKSGDEPPSAVQVAGTDGIQIGGVKRDFLNPQGIWLWAAADNLRLTAQNAVSAAETIFLH